MVKLLLLIANRHLVEGYKGYCTTAMVRGEVVAVPLALPVELWTDWILPFLGRDTLLLAPFPDLCEYCGEGAVRRYRCPACRAAYFCGDAHRRAGWDDHKKRCTFKYRKPKKKEKKGGGGGTK